MRKYQRNRVPSREDPAARQEEGKRERWLAQAGAQLAKLGMGQATPPALQAPSAINPPGAGDLDGFFKLFGRPGGQQGHGGTGAGQSLELGSTSDPIKGFIYFGLARQTAWDETNNRLGIGTPTPAQLLHLNTAALGTAVVGALGTPWGRLSVGGTVKADLAPLHITGGIGGTVDVALVLSLGALAVIDSSFAQSGFRLAFTSNRTFLQAGRRLSDGSNANMNMTLGGIGAAYGTHLGVAFGQTFFDNDTASPQIGMGVGLNPTAFGGGNPWVGVLAVRSISTTQPAAVLLPNSDAANASILEFYSLPFTGGKRTSFEWHQSAARVRLSWWASGGATRDAYLSAVASEIGGGTSKFATFQGATDRRTATFDYFNRYSDAVATMILCLGDTVSSHRGASISGIDSAALTRFNIAALTSLVSNEVPGGAVLAPGAMWHIRNSQNAAMPLLRLQPHSSQSADILQVRNTTDAANLMSVDSLGKIIATTGIRIPHRTEYPANSITQTVDTLALDVGDATFIRLSASGGVDISGITNGVDGRKLYVLAVTNSINFKSDDVAAVAANRIRTNTLNDLILNSGDVAKFIYDGTVSRWRMFKYLTAGSEVITGDWTFHGQVIIEDTGTLIVNGKPSVTTVPSIYFFDEDTGFTQTLQAATDIADGSIYALPAMNGASDVIIMADLAQTLNNKTVNMKVDTASSGSSFFDVNTTTKRLRPVLSGAVGNNSLTVNSTAARDYSTFDFTSRLVGGGATAVAAGGSVAVGSLGTHDTTTPTGGSIAATTLGNTVPAGKYRVSWVMVITTAGDAAPTDQIVVTVAYNDGAARNVVQGAMNEAGAFVASPLPVNTLNRVYVGSHILRAAASTNISIATTLTNGAATNPLYTFSATLEAVST